MFILILCSPRTGSSMVAKIFHNHGVWTGETCKVNRFNYDSYENESLKNCVKSYWHHYSQIHGKHFGTPMEACQEYINGVNKAIANEKPTNPWLFKMFVEGYKLFLHLKPKFVLIRRDTKQAIQSMKDKNPNNHDLISKIHNDRMNSMEYIEKTYGAAWVNTDEIIEGNYSSLNNAFDFCGLEFNSIIADNSIEKQKWHYKRN